MIEYRDRIAREWHLDICYSTNTDAISAKQTFSDEAVDRVSCCRLLTDG